jgi:hypothetical protein
MTTKNFVFKYFLLRSDLPCIDEGLSIINNFIRAKEGRMKIERIYIPGGTVDRTDPEHRKNRHDFRDEKERQSWKQEEHHEEEQIDVIDTAANPLMMGKKKIDLIA